MRYRRSALVVTAVLMLTACATGSKVSVAPIEPVYDPCPSEGLADVQSAPKYPLTQSSETNTLYAAIARAVGTDRAQEIIRYWEAELPTWGKLGWHRVQAMQAWCAKRSEPVP